MNDRCFAVGLTVIIAALSAASPASAQNDSSRAGQWTVSRTADGQPDLRGIWDFRTITPMERPIISSVGNGGSRRQTMRRSSNRAEWGDQSCLVMFSTFNVMSYCREYFLRAIIPCLLW